MENMLTAVEALDPADMNLQEYTSRLNVFASPPINEMDAFATDVRQGLGATQKSLPCKYIYDRNGSRLFERICQLPEYYPTRTEEKILTQNATDMIASLNGTRAMTELGAGSALKTDVLIGEFLAQNTRFLYNPIDISKEMIRMCAQRLLTQHDALDMVAFICDYDTGLAASHIIDQPKVFAFLGSSLGNFGREASFAFIKSVAGAMESNDFLLLGLDMDKNVDVLEQAYDDAQKVTAAFSKNVLARINGQLGGEFDPDTFDYQARYDPESVRVEMHLVSRLSQSVPIRDLDINVDFEAGESIHTENSHKFTPSIIDSLCEAAGLRIIRFWSDERHWFRVVLLRRAAL